MAQAFPVLVRILVPLTVFLAFLALPMLGKQLVPVFSGSESSWLGCVAYFSLMFLLGHAWAAWLTTKRPVFQMTAIVLLGLLAVATFHLPSSEAASASMLRTLWRLAFSTLPALVLLFSTGPILQNWLRLRGETLPYYLHVVANLGSLAALVLYPFFFESTLFLPELAFYWHGSLVVVAGLLAATAFIFRQTSGGQTRPVSSSPAGQLSPGLFFLGLWLSALAAGGFLGATHYITAEIGSSPLAWVGPLGLYFFSLLVTFSGRWQRWMTLVTLVWLGVSLTGFMVTKGFLGVTVNYHTAWWLLSLTASGSFLANALLAALCPVPARGKIQLVAAGGCLLGALAAGLVVPHLFVRPTEFLFASTALLTTGLLWLTGRREPATVAVMACVLFTPVLGLGLFQASQEGGVKGHMQHLRDSYGHVMVRTDARSVVLSSETTTKASQLTMTEDARHRPTLYYTESTGVGRVIDRLAASRPELHVGIVGLGAGTLAAYARSNDTYKFWDSDPKMHRVARENFTYIADSAGHIEPVLRDGRDALEHSQQDFDLLVIDAVTSAGTPAYLLTREAIETYETRLAKRDGLLVIHSSSRYSTIFPVIEATARTLGLASLGVTTEISDSTPTSDWDPTRTDYIIVCRPGVVADIAAWFQAEEDKGRVKHRLTTTQAPAFNQQLIWRDERNATLDNLELGRFLFEY